MWFWISFFLLGLFVYLPIGLLLLAVIAIPLDSYLAKTQKTELAQPITYILVFLLIVAAVLFHGGLFGWYDKIEQPNDILVSVDDEVKNDFYTREEKDDKIYLTVSDKNFSKYTDSHLTDNGSIHFDVKNENAKKDRANLVWTIKINDKEYKRDDLPTGTETPLFGDNFALDFGETTVYVTAKNDLGETTKVVIIKKLKTETECEKPENAEKKLCKSIADANRADSEKKAAEEEKRQQNQGKAYNPVYSPEIDTLDGTTDTTNCSYVKNGKCWDNVLEQADEDGWGDAYYYGDDFSKAWYYRGCDGECADIYDDAYWKARDNGRDSKRY